MSFALAMFGCSVRGYAASEPQAPLGTAPPISTGVVSGQASSMHLAKKFGLAMAFVGLVAGIGWWLVVSTRRSGGEGFSFLQKRARAGAFRIDVLGYRRITARLSIVAVEVPPGTVIVLADNGHTVTKLHEASIQKPGHPVES